MASQIYNEYKAKIGTIDWSSVGVDIRVILVTSAYTPDEDNHANYDDITNELPTANGYTLGGALLVNKAIGIDTTNDWSKFDADDVTWVTSTLTARGAVVYFDTGVPATSTLIAYIDFISDKVSNAGDFVIQWHTDGVFRIG